MTEQKNTKEKKAPPKLTAQMIARAISDPAPAGRSPTTLTYVESLGAFALHVGTHHRLLEGLEMERWVWWFAADVFPDIARPSSTVIKETVFQLRYGSPHYVKELDGDRIAFDDGVLDLHDMTLSPSEPDVLAVRKLNMRYEDVKVAECPLFEKFVADTFVDENGNADVDLARAVQEMFGYTLLTSMPATAAFFLVGEGANGKSVLSEVLREMNGKHYSAAMTLEALTMNRFAAAHLVGKFVNISNEEESKYMKSDKFKALVSGDTITADRKFDRSFEFQPQAKMIFATNEMPTFDGVNYGIRRRLKIIPFNRIVPQNERDPFLTKKLIAEMPGIVKWSLAGLTRLIENKYDFTDSSPARAARALFDEESSTVVGFVKDTYDLDAPAPSVTISSTDIYEDYKEWCVKNGRKPLAKSRMFKDLNRMVPEMSMRRRQYGKERERGYAVDRIGPPRSTDPSF